ncbi:restriction endonuclease subunit S [Providencia huaxiensis]|uniref:restriction endonuclease subunit S n=1 Tax=Providencia huaxiensis TaxID=2027290 RepID=UPI000C7E915B|nr:restriction endonuclease subunit S [Providencia huaxiensis]AXH63839.1 restriction endonuclease subunit S [Providencia huaxiensis]
MNMDKKVPEIRFKGFSGEWLNNPIGTICGTTFGGGTPSTSEKSFWQGDIPWIQSSDLQNNSISSVNAKKYITKEAINKSAAKLVSGNSIAIVTRVGVGKLSLMEDEYATSQDFLSLSDLKADPQYSAYALWIQLQIEKEQVQGTSIKGITKNELLSKTINYPEIKSEQTAIGSYFKKLDSLINQHQQKHDKLSNIKKAMIEKMFPKQGEAVPEIRFKGFSGEWEEKSVSQLGEIITGSTPSTQNLANYSNDGIPWVTPTDISRNVTFNTAKRLSLVGCKVARIVPKNTILVTCIASIGKNTILGSQGSFNQQINGVVPNEKENNPYFLYSASVLWSEKLKRSASSGTMQIVNKTEFSELKNRVPKKEEQIAIGNYFQKLDVLINQHQQQITKLNNIKQACLSKMFV